MTEPKAETHHDVLDWEYSQAEKQAIRDALPKALSDDEFSMAISSLCHRINTPDNGQVRDFLGQSKNELSNINDAIVHISKTLDFLNCLSENEYHIEDNGGMNRTVIGVRCDAVIGPLSDILSDIINFQNAMNLIFDRIDSVENLYHPRKTNKFSFSVCRAADRLWFDCLVKAGVIQACDDLDPSYGKGYTRFLEAVARPVLSCPRFRRFGADWTDNLAKTHADRMKRINAAWAKMDEDHITALAALSKNSE